MSTVEEAEKALEMFHRYVSFVSSSSSSSFFLKNSFQKCSVVAPISRIDLLG